MKTLIKKEKVFTLFWLTGDAELIKGSDIARALYIAGYGGGALAALDFYSEGDDTNKWVWSKEEKKWKFNAA